MTGAVRFPSGETATDDRAKKAFFIVEPNRMQLTEIPSLLAAQPLRAFVAAVVPLSQAAEAYSRRIQKRGAGKVAVAVAPDSRAFRQNSPPVC
jgi:NADPH:quinone reductase-like Zn-dependent oxidoreductase